MFGHNYTSMTWQVTRFILGILVGWTIAIHHNLGWLGRRISLALYLPRIPVYLDAVAFLRRSHLYQRPCTRLLRYIRHTMSNTL